MATKEQKRAELRSILTPEELAQLDGACWAPQVKYINSSEEQRAGRPGRSVDDPPLPYDKARAERMAMLTPDERAEVSREHAAKALANLNTLKTDDHRREIEAIRLECLAKAFRWAAKIEATGNEAIRLAGVLEAYILNGAVPPVDATADKP